MNIQNRIKKLEDTNKAIESAKDCGCPNFMVIAPGEREQPRLCPKCIQNVETIVILPSLDSMPRELENFGGKVYAGIDIDRV